MEAVERGLHLEVLPAGRIRVGPRPLSHDADRAAHALGLAQDVEAGHPCLAAVGAREREQVER
jgi:hypothetical protein